MAAENRTVSGMVRLLVICERSALPYLQGKQGELNKKILLAFSKPKREMGLIGVLALSIALVGCASALPVRSYGTTEAETLSSRLAPSEESSASISAGPLTLEQAIQFALANNPDIGAGTWEVEAARAAHEEVFGQRWPQVSAVGAYTHSLDDQRLVPARKPQEASAFSDEILTSDLVVSLPLFTGGRITNEIRAADLLRIVEEHRLTRTRRELIFDVSAVFYAILAQELVVESVNFSYGALEEHRKVVQDLLAAEKAAKVDLLRTEVRLAEIGERLVRERNVLAIQLRLLAVLMGLEAHTAEISVQGPLEFIEALTDLERSLAEAFASRADYLAARHEAEAQARRVDIARSERWPTVSLQGSYGGRWATDSVAPRGADDSEDVGQAAVVVSVPLFEGGSIQAGIRKERARLAAAEERVRRLELRIRLDVETSLLNIDSGKERVKTTEKAIAQAQESLRIERLKYELGKGAIVDVLDAQSALLEAETGYYRALADYNTAVAQLRLATGKDA